MKLASWNINGLRSCLQKGLLDWINRENLDIICFQETRISSDQIPSELKNLHHYDLHFVHATKKGYSGVGFLIKKTLPPLLSLQTSLGIPEFDQEGRTMILEFPQFFLFGCYFPNGQRDHARVPYKMEYCRKVLEHANALREKYSKGIIFCGDFNTAHHPIDLKNPQGNLNTTGFLSIEREFLDEFVGQGYVDIFREKHPGEAGHYTWWTYRNGCRERNIGWRIDYFFISRDLLPFVSRSFHGPEVLGSDHCPIYLHLSLLE